MIEPDGTLHADGFFTCARRDGYMLDRKLPCNFYLAPPAPKWLCLRCQSTRQGFHFTDCPEFARSLNVID